MDNNKLAPTIGKLRRLLDQADRMVHIVEQSNDTKGRKNFGVFVTMGPHLINLNPQLYTLDILQVEEVGEDYFPEMIIAQVKTGLSECLGMTGIKFQTHAAAKRKTPAAPIKQEQE